MAQSTVEPAFVAAMEHDRPDADKAAKSLRRSFVGNKALVLILVAGAAIRILLLGWFQDQPLYDDERAYNRIAVNLAESGEYAAAPGEPTSIRPPLYPAFLAAVYKICGLENFQAVRILQACLALVLVVVVYFLAKEMFSTRVANWAAAMCCFYPSLLGFGNLLLTETLFGVLLCLACLALQRFLHSRSWGLLVLVGFLLGLAALTRSVLWLFPPFLFVFLLWASTEVSWRRRLVVASVPVLAFALTIMPWAVRNSRLQQTFVTVDVMGGRNFMMGNYEYTPLYRTWDAIRVQGEKAWHRILAAENPDFSQKTQGQRDKLALRRGLRFVLTHPGLTAKRDIVKFFNFWQLERSLVGGAARGYWGSLSRPAVVTLTIVIFGSYALAIIFGVFGFVTITPADRRMHWFLLLLVGFICAVHTAVFGHSRYHLVLMPLVLIYSGNALVNAQAIWRSRGRWFFWVAVAICTVLIGSWLWEVAFVDLERFRTQVLS